MEKFGEVLSKTKEHNKILIVEGDVDFDTSGAIVIDCEKSKERAVRGYTIFKNAERLSKKDLTTIRQNWEDCDCPVVIWSNKRLGDKIDDSMKWRALYFIGE